MANTSLIKRSSVANKVPTTSDLSLGELAVNTYDGKLFLKKSVGGTESIVDLTNADKLDGQDGSYYTGYTDTAISNLIDSAPNALNTLNELSAALNDDANFSTTVTNSIATKLPLAGGTLSGDLTVNGVVITGSTTNLATNSIASSTQLAVASLGGNNNYVDLSILGGRTGRSIIKFGDQDNYNIGSVEYFHNDNSLNFFTNGSTTSRLTIASNGNATFAATVTATTFSGSGASLTNIPAAQLTGVLPALDGSNLTGLTVNNASTLDNLDSTQFLRSDANDTSTGKLHLTYSSQYPLDINSSHDGKIVIQGSSNPYIRWREGTTDKAFIQWNSNGYLRIANQEDGSQIRLQDDIRFSTDNFNSTNYKIWHQSNDGSGSGLDSDTLDGVQGSSYLRSDTNDTFSGNLTLTGALAVTGNIANSAGQITCGVHGTSGIQIINDGTFGTLHSVDLVLRTASTERARLDTNGNFELNNTNAAFKSISSSSGNFIRLYAGAGTGKWDIYGHGANLRFTDNNSAGSIVFDHNVDANGGLDVTGNIAVSGTVDGRDVAADGSKLDTYEANGSSYLRSDANDTASGLLQLTNGAIYPLDINGANNGKLLLRGSVNPYIRFRENNTDKAYIQWSASGYLKLKNDEDGSTLRLRDVIQFSTDDSTFYTMWHGGNDGSGSGLDADTLDGVDSTSFVRSDASDTMSGTYTISTSADQKLILAGSTNPYIRFQENTTNKAYIQWDGSQLILVNQESSDYLRIGSGLNGLIYQADGVSGTVWHSGNDGSGSGLDSDTLDGVQAAKFLTSYSSSATGGWEDNNRNFRVTTGGDAAGLAFHESDGTFAFQVYGDGSAQGFLIDNWGSWDLRKYYNGQLYLRVSGTDYLAFHAGNDGSGSGLDADKLDGVQGSSFLRSDADDDATGNYNFSDSNGSDDPVIHVKNTGNATGNYGGAFLCENQYGNHSYGMVAEFRIGASGQDRPAISFSSGNSNTHTWGIGFVDNNTDHFRIRHGYGYRAGAWGTTRFSIHTDGTLYAGELTNKIWHQGNDGSGSGLDADSLDGIGSTGFLRSNVSDNVGGTLTFISGSGLNLCANDIYLQARVINNPNTSTLNDGMYIGYGNGSNGATRIYGGGTTSGGLVISGNGASDINFNSQKVFYSGNDGSGSGLDADTLDGVQGSSYLRSDVDDSYSGDLNINGMSFKGGNVPRNLKLEDNTANTDVGVSLFNGQGTWTCQLYGHVGSYGFLDGNWAGWDIRKYPNGQFQVDEGSGLQRVWNAGNDGSGSGLDADTLDGKDLSNSYTSTNSVVMRDSNGNMNAHYATLRKDVSGGVGAYLTIQNQSGTTNSKCGIAFGIGASNAILDGSDYGEAQIKCFNDSGGYGNLEINLHTGANRPVMKMIGNGSGQTGAGAGTEGMRGGVAFGNAGIAIDRSWMGQPGIHVFNANVENDTDQGTFRFHGWNRSYGSYPASSGSDFGVTLVADGMTLTSDRRRKTGITTITDALATVLQMRGVAYTYVNEELQPQTHMSMDNGKKLGFIAQEVIPLLPQLIHDSGEKAVERENGYCDRYNMDYGGVAPLLVEAIKELVQRIVALESK